MTAEDPAPPRAAEVPPAARGVGVLGVVLAVLGVAVMLGGLSFVYVHAKRFTKAPVPVTAPPVPVVPGPPVKVPPAPAPPVASAPATAEHELPFIAVPPFPEDRTALVP